VIWSGQELLKRLVWQAEDHAKASQGQLNLMHIPHGLTRFQAVACILLVVLLIVLPVTE
jgi:hypothetical protein